MSSMRPDQETRYDLVIIGGGIAGLAIGEILARSGFRVLIVEKNPRLCQETSGKHHEWFHFGSLYSILLHNQHLRTMVGGIDDLLEYYSDFEGMNLRVTDAGRLVSRDGDRCWFSDRPIDYVVSATNDPDFWLSRATGPSDWCRRVAMGLSWDYLIKQFISRHNRFHKFDWRTGPASRHIPKAGVLDYSRDVIHKFRHPDVALDPDTHFMLHGYDRPFSAIQVIQDLARSFLLHGGKFRLETEYRDHDANSEAVRVQLGDGDELFARWLLFATGHKLQEHLRGKREVNVVASPLLVVYPAVCDVNIVRLTPFPLETINHLTHEVDGHSYSVIGGGYAANPNDETSLRTVEQALLTRARAVFPKVAQAEFTQVYFGYKTEMSSSVKTRNYQYRIEKIDDRVISVVPGKFSLGFSLAVNCFKQIVGRDPERHSRCDRDRDVSHLVDEMHHRKLVAEHLKKSTVQV